MIVFSRSLFDVEISIVTAEYLQRPYTDTKQYNINHYRITNLRGSLLDALLLALDVIENHSSGTRSLLDSGSRFTRINNSSLLSVL